MRFRLVLLSLLLAGCEQYGPDWHCQAAPLTPNPAVPDSLLPGTPTVTICVVVS